MMNNEINNTNISATSGTTIQTYGSNFVPLTKKVKPLSTVEFTKSDLFSLLTTIIILFFVSYFGILNGFNFGFSVTMLAFITFVFFYLYNKKSKGKPFNIFLYSSCVLLTTTFSLNSDGLIKFISIIYLLFILIISFSGISNNITHKDSTFFWIFDAFFRPLSSTFENIFSPFKSMRFCLKNEKLKNATSVFIGIAVAIPALFVIVPLLASSDIAFDSVLTKFSNNPEVLPFAFLLTVLLTLIFYSLIFYFKKSVLLEKEKVKTQKGKLPVNGINAFLLSISIVYLFYLFTQLAYIVDAFKFVLPEDYSAAEFARSGFFEMAVIVFINFVILACTALKVKRNNSRLPKSSKGILLFISAFSIFYISTAIFKMMKYISLYGLTRLRVLTSVFMIMLALIFIIIILKLLINKLRYLKPIIIVCTLTLLSVSMVNINTVIADYNYKAFKEGKIKIDVYQISSLGVSGIPVLTKLADEPDEDISFEAKEAIYCSKKIYYNAFDSEAKKLSVAKEEIFEYNKIWLDSKAALDEFKKTHPDFTKENFEKERTEYYTKQEENT